MMVLLFSLLAKMVLHKNEKNKIPMIVMPFVKRNPNTLDAALLSVENARGSMPVLLVGNPEYKPGWCSHFQCIESPPLPSKILENAIEKDVRGDSKKFIEWRTKEAWNALFAMQSFLNTNREFMIWLQDDVFVLDFYNLPLKDLVCLRVGKEYCGMVSYLMKRWVVEEFVKRIKLEMEFKPLDWILDDLRLNMGLQIARVEKVKHKGKSSSNKKTRTIDI